MECVGVLREGLPQLSQEGLAQLHGLMEFAELPDRGDHRFVDDQLVLNRSGVVRCQVAANSAGLGIPIRELEMGQARHGIKRQPIVAVPYRWVFLDTDQRHSVAVV